MVTESSGSPDATELALAVLDGVSRGLLVAWLMIIALAVVVLAACAVTAITDRRRRRAR